MNTLNEAVATNDAKLTLQDVQNKIEELVNKAKKSKNGEEQSLEFNQTLEELIKLRAKLMVAYGPVINLIEQIETEVKNLDPAAGKYGSSYGLTITKTSSQIVDEKAVAVLIKKSGRDPLNYFKLKLSDDFVKVILKENPKLATKGDGSKRFSYAKK